MLRPPVLANLPATKLKAPWIRLNSAEFGAPVRSQENSFSTKRVVAERLNAVPSMKVILTAPSAPVSIVSP